MSKTRNRAIALTVLAVFSLVIFCSSAFIIVHTDHNCTGEDCSVCIELAECHKTLNTLGTALTGIVNHLVIMFALSVIVKCFTKTRSDHTTLISLKVELLN